jgi:hypothetical protein
MKKLTLVNAFSINMINRDIAIDFKEVTIDKAKELVNEAEEFECAIGHVDTAVVVGDMLGMALEANRTSVSIDVDEALLVAQYTGPRLPEGATTLPEGATIKFWFVTVMTDYYLM